MAGSEAESEDVRHRRHGLVTTLLRRHWRGGVTVLVALGALALLTAGPAGIAMGVRDYTDERAQAREDAQHQLGTEVRDGEVSFVVHKVHCGEAKKRTEYGQYCEVTVGARNDGPEEVTVPGEAQRLHGSEGARHMPIDGDAKPFGTLAPGEATTATIGFDLPPHSTVTHVEVHATLYTRGQAVAIFGPPLPLQKEPSS